MKKIAIGSMVFVVLIYCALIGYVASAEDFVEPNTSSSDLTELLAQEDMSAGIWTRTLDELADYLAENGIVDRNDYIKINYGADEEVRSGYRFGGIIDIVYYDMLKMDESTSAYDEYELIYSTGTFTYSNGTVGYFYVNGPFVLHFYEWGTELPSEEEQQEIIDIFMNFGKD